MRVEPVTAGAVAQHHGPVNTSVGSIMDLSPLGRVDNPSGGAEVVAFRVSHNNVVNSCSMAAPTASSRATSVLTRDQRCSGLPSPDTRRSRFHDRVAYVTCQQPIKCWSRDSKVLVKKLSRPTRSTNARFERGAHLERRVSHVSHTRAQLRRTGRIALITSTFSLALAVGVAGPAMAGSSNGPLNKPQTLSKADLNSGGANGQCPGGPYCSTRNGSPSLNGNGNGKATGKPCAGCVGKADNKNPKGQMPNGTDHNAGYECDRNNGIGKSNPAHTACIPTVTPPAVCVPKANENKNYVPEVVTPPAVCVPKGNENSGCVPNVVTRPVVLGVVATAPSVAPPVVLGVVATAPSVAQPEVLGVVTVAPQAAPVLATHPLPKAAAAGQASTSGQLIAAGFAAFAAFLAFGTRFVLRRRHGVV